MHAKGFADDIFNTSGKTEADESELPDLKGPYQAHSRAANKAVYSLHCLLGAEGCRTFEYVQKDSNSEFRATEQGQMIRLRFVGSKIWELTIVGLNLWRLYDLIGQHRMSWMRKSDRGFASGKDNEPLIVDLSIKEIDKDNE